MRPSLCCCLAQSCHTESVTCFSWAAPVGLPNYHRSNRHVFRTNKATNQALSFVVLHSCAEYGRVELPARKYQAGVSQENGVIKKITLPDSHFQSRPHTHAYTRTQAHTHTHTHTHLQTHTHTHSATPNRHTHTDLHTHIWMPRVRHIVTPFD